MAEPRIVELTPQATVAVRVQQPMAELDLASLFERYLPGIAQQLAGLGATPSAPPFGRYHEFGPDRVDVEIGIGVDAPIAELPPLGDCEPGEIGTSELPGGRAATTTHLGPYDTLTSTYDELHEWLEQEGHAAGPGPWESYVDDPDQVDDVSKLRTEVYWPLG